MKDIAKQVALVTGGSKGIGYGVAEALVKLGANVAITARSKEEVTLAAEKLTELGPGKAIGFVCDVRDMNSQRNVVDQTIHEFGALDAVIANAGVGKFGNIADLSEEDWAATIDTNLTGVFYTVKASLEALKKSKGFLVTIASLAGTNFFQGGAAYNASKFGLVGFTQAVMLDVREAGVRVSTIMPGSVSTHFAGHTPSPEDAWKIQPEDVGQLVVDLLRMPARTLPSKVEVRPAQTKPKA